MNELEEWQRAFQQQLFDSNNQTPNPATDSEVRFSVYQNAYRSRLVDALKRDYKTLLELLGETAFNSLSKEYIDLYPSTFRSIRWFGKYFPEFIKQHTDKRIYYEMAQFEWALTEAFDAKDSNFITMKDMLNIQPYDWPDLQFYFHASVRYFDFQWNTIPIWKTYDKEGHIIKPESLPTNTAWIIWRREFDSHFRKLSEEESWALKAALNKEHFSDICEGLCQWIDERNAAHFAATLIKQWLGEGLVMSFVIVK